MSERREWKAEDAEEIRRMFPDEPRNDEETAEAWNLALHFGCEIRHGMPEGPGYWALEPRCVLRDWFKRPGDKSWTCLGCYGSSAFDGDIREAFMREFRAKLANPCP